MSRVGTTGVRRFVSVAFALMFGTAMALAQGQGPGGGGGGQGGGPPTGGEEAVNNLAYPGALTAGLENATLIWTPPVGGGILGVHYSYGCDKPEGDYANTSCISPVDGSFMTAAECASYCGGAAVSRMYWQKVAETDWWAQTTAVLPSQLATFVDWGDNLESVSWSESSVVRVETTPYAPVSALNGLEMWHVSGRGPDEVWGARATDSTSPQAYVYVSDYGSIYTTTARLDATKLGGAATCPESAVPSPYLNLGTWSNGSWTGAGFVEVLDEPYTAELNVQGKYVHGYNLMMRRLPTSPTKLGWWRLTFYTTGGAVQFDPAAVPTPPTVVTVLAEEEEGSLYTPVIDSVNDITYIDICIKSKKGTRTVPPGQSK